MSLKHLIPLGNIPGVDYYSLQAGEGAEEIMDASSSFLIADVCSQFPDFADTAAFIAGLDLVITVDTVVAHLAGALGIPVWILIANPRSCWRWMRDRSDTPWYPSARLFRQPNPGDWTGLIDIVKVKLEEMAAKHTKKNHLV
jgi:ADP-heptose:LPS heptosyltransferase